MEYIGLCGYCDRPNAAPGETLTFHVDCAEKMTYHASVIRLINGDPSVDGPEVKNITGPSNIEGEYDGVPQWTTTGSFVEVPDPEGAFSLKAGGTVHLFLYAVTPQVSQTVIGRWDETASRGWALLIEDGFLTLVVGDGERTQKLASSRRLFAEVWYSVALTLDVVGKTLALAQVTKINSVNSRVGRTSALDSDAREQTALEVVPLGADAPLLMAARVVEHADGTARCRGCFNGKIDAPKLYGEALGSKAIGELHDGAVPAGGLLAHWDFSAEITKQGVPSDKVSDATSGGRHGQCVNQPDRAMTGWNWDSHEENFVHCPEQYGAIDFHEDSLDDCRWSEAFRLEVPDDLPSGAYAVLLHGNGHIDRIPFFVTPPRGQANAKIALLIPTFSYLAYANSQIMQGAPIAQSVIGIMTVLSTPDLELNENTPRYGLSTYDHHTDGAGVRYSTWRRPIFNLRPDHRHEYGAVWQFPADLHLIEWLDELGFEYDVITDHDLDRDGAALLERYSVVTTATHPEYYSRRMLDAWEDYIVGGGRAMYLAANGFYWITSLHPDKPWLIEMRRGESGDQAWRARCGETFHSTTGERGGIWRHRGRAPQKIWSTGYSTHALDVSVGYVQMPDAADPRVAWIMEGVEPDEVIGDFGQVHGGAAGLELDRIDYSLGTPPNTLLLAASHGHTSSAALVPEDIYFSHPGTNGEEDPAIHADLTYYTSSNGGAVFSVSSMTWCGSLSHNGADNNVSTITRNVLERFAADDPVPEIV